MVPRTGNFLCINIRYLHCHFPTITFSTFRGIAVEKKIARANAKKDNINFQSHFLVEGKDLSFEQWQIVLPSTSLAILYYLTLPCPISKQRLLILVVQNLLTSFYSSRGLTNILMVKPETVKTMALGELCFTQVGS